MILLKKIVRRLQKLIRETSEIIEPVAAVSGFTSALYYLFFSSGFRLEQQAVLKGKIAYRRSLRNPRESSYLLRRNIHRLEKGLIMEPRRAVFARDYIGQTVAAFESTAKASTDHKTATELLWARGVLDEYFDVVSISDDTKVQKAWKHYCGLAKQPGVSGFPKPYAADALSARPVTPEQFAELCRVRRSVRWYENRAVPRDVVDRAIVAAGTAPSACNRQPFRYIILDTPDLLSKVATIPMGATGFSDNFPALAVLVGDLGAYFDERDRHVIYIDGSLSAMTFMFALQTEGIASCSINWPDLKTKEKALRNELELKPSERVVMMMSLGYARPDGMVPASVKRPLPQLRQYNSLSG